MGGQGTGGQVGGQGDRRDRGQGTGGGTGGRGTGGEQIGGTGAWGTVRGNIGKGEQIGGQVSGTGGG